MLRTERRPLWPLCCARTALLQVFTEISDRAIQTLAIFRPPISPRPSLLLVPASARLLLLIEPIERTYGASMAAAELSFCARSLRMTGTLLLGFSRSCEGQVPLGLIH